MSSSAHKIGILFQRCFVVLLTCLSSTVHQKFPAAEAANKPEKKDANTASPVVRTFSFPQESVGTFYSVPFKTITIDNPTGSLRLLCRCAGKVTVKIPDGYVLLFAPDKNLLNHPEKFKAVSLDNIDILNLQNCVCMDDSSEGVTDRLLKAAVPSNSVKWMVLSHSDVTDAGLTQLVKFPHVVALDCCFTEIRGTSFPTVAALPSLKQLHLGECSIEAKHYAELAKSLSLQELHLRGARIRLQELNTLIACRQLTYLNLRGNKSVDDKAISVLQALSKLRYLNVSGTPVTAAGLAHLARLPLSQLVVDHSLSNQMASLQKIFPGRVHVWDPTSKEVNSDINKIFSPLR